MRYKQHLFLLFIVAILVSALQAFGSPQVTGTWTKVYFEQEGKKNADPRWSVEISFRDDGTFRWESVSSEEERLVHKDTGEHRTEVRGIKKELKGNYSISGGTITFTFSPVPQGEDIPIATLNLGLENATGRGTMSFRLEEGALTLSVPSGQQRVFHLKRKDDKPSNNAGELRH